MRRGWPHIVLILLPAALALGIAAATRRPEPARDPRVRALVEAGDSQLSRVLMFDHDPAVAEALFTKARAIEPDCPEALRGLGILRVRGGNPHEGLKHLLAYLEANPKDAQANLHAARAYRSENNSDVAFLYYRRACSADPTDAAGRKELARYLLERGRRSEAFSAATEAAALTPDDPEARSLVTLATDTGAPKLPAAAPLRPDRFDPTPAIADPLAGLRGGAE